MPSRRTGRPPGRPGPGFRWAHIHCQVHPTIHAALKRLAADRKLTVGATVTELVKSYLDRRENASSRRQNQADVLSP
jgi:hypothetical protein